MDLSSWLAYVQHPNGRDGRRSRAMAGRPRTRAKLAALRNGYSIGGGSHVDTRLPIQSDNEKGSMRDSNLSLEREADEIHKSLRGIHGNGTYAGPRKNLDCAVSGDGGGLRPRRGRPRKIRPSSEEDGIPSVGPDRDTKQPDVSNGYRASSGEAASLDPEARICQGDGVLSQSDKFVQASELALDRALEILKLDPLETDAEGNDKFSTSERFRLLTLQKETISTVLSAVARVDEARLKGKKQDRMAELLAAIKEAEG